MTVVHPGTTPQASGFALEFSETDDFSAYREAVGWLEVRGYSVGAMQRGAPCGILWGDYGIQKWRNLSSQDRAELDGQLVGNFRNGPVVIHLRNTPVVTGPTGRTGSEPASTGRNQ